MTPAERLVGQTLKGGWLVVEKLAKPGTGGNFSVGYKAEHPDHGEAFVKALDYTASFDFCRRRGMGPTDIMKTLSDDYYFERDFSQRCKNLSLKRVAHAIESGHIDVDPTHHLGMVEYLIFEFADADVRTYLSKRPEVDEVFALRSLHHIASALFHLHSANMAHQDLKPSNTLYWHDKGAKICDFGRSWSHDIKSPYDDSACAGDPTYTPFEFMLNAVPLDVDARRFGCDIYMFGSMIVFCFTRLSINGLINSNILKSIRPFNWGGSFATNLPYIQAAFAESLEQFGECVPGFYRNDLVDMVAQLCEPDPSKRGHPEDRKSRKYSMQRYISRLDLLSHKAEIRQAIERGTP
jgi:serine/threonine protein kinase